MRENLKNILAITGAIAVYFLFVWGSGNLPAATNDRHPEPENPQAEVFDWLDIPKLQISAPIIYVESAAEAAIQVGLSLGVVHYPDTAQPGKVGNCYIVGHSSDYSSAKGDYKQVFAGLLELEIGDEIFIAANGETFRYLVSHTKIVAPDDLSALSQETGGRRVLTLQTSYPVGSADRRFLAVAELE